MTVPAAPLLKTTVLLPGVVLKPKPLIVTVPALAAMAGIAGGHHGRDRAYLDGRAAAGAIGGDHGGKAALGRRAWCQTSR